MALKDIVIETSEIVYRESNFTVHGLTLDIVMDLMSKGHRPEMEKAIDTIRLAVGDDFDKGVDTADVLGALACIVQQVPEMVAKVIAGAADEPDMWSAVRKLPIDVQLDALMKIGKLTFDGEDSIKKFVTNLIEMMVAIRKSATPAILGAKEQLAGMKA